MEKRDKLKVNPIFVKSNGYTQDKWPSFFDKYGGHGKWKWEDGFKWKGP